MEKENHNFHDMNKFPKEYGIVVFPISISRTDNMTGQDPRQCMDYLHYFSPSKVATPKIGLNVVYGDFLYFHSQTPASILKKKFMHVVLKHKNAFQKLIGKNHERFQIQHAFSFEVWNQLYLSYEGDFAEDFLKFRRIYDKDEKFQKYLVDDAAFAERDIDENQINFFLEEHFMFYLISKKKVALPNEYIQGREKWVLWCYPGPLMKTQIYTYQLNPLQLNASENPYQNHGYDLSTKRLVDASLIDLNTYNYSSS